MCSCLTAQESADLNELAASMVRDATNEGKPEPAEDGKDRQQWRWAGAGPEGWEARAAKLTADPLPPDLSRDIAAADTYSLLAPSHHDAAAAEVPACPKHQTRLLWSGRT